MSRPLRVGVQLPEVERRVEWPELLTMARTAEDAGLDSLWLGDHLLYDLPGGVTRGPWEVWTSLAALAAVTSRVELGPFVASTGFHAPPMLAKMAATVDAISGGRLLLGLGAGWNEREYTAFGFPFDHRISRFEEAFTVIRTLVARRPHRLPRRLLRRRRLRPGPGTDPTRRPADHARLDRSADDADRASACGPLERLVERLRQLPGRVRDCCGNGSRPPRRRPDARRARSGRRLRSWSSSPAGAGRVMGDSSYGRP